MTPKLETIIVRVLMVPAMLFAFLLWSGLGLWSPQALGRALEQAGKNLQDYDW